MFELWKPVVKRQPWLPYTGKLPPKAIFTLLENYLAGFRADLSSSGRSLCMQMLQIGMGSNSCFVSSWKRRTRLTGCSSPDLSHWHLLPSLYLHYDCCQKLFMPEHKFWGRRQNSRDAQWCIKICSRQYWSVLQPVPWWGQPKARDVLCPKFSIHPARKKEGTSLLNKARLLLSQVEFSTWTVACTGKVKEKSSNWEEEDAWCWWHYICHLEELMREY